METVGFESANDQQIFPCKSHFEKAQKKKDRMMNYQPLISRAPSENFYQTPWLQTGFLQQQQQHRPAPRGHFHSYPPFSSSPQQQKQKQQQQQQPPLLPLPLPHTRIRNPDPHSLVRSLSCQPTNRKTTPRKSKQQQQPLPTVPKILKPTAKDIEDQVTKIYNSSISGSSSTTSANIKLMKDGKAEVPDFSGLSPPPSSLPLPTFSLRPKLSCNVMAAGFDAGATDNLQRLLRLG